MSMGCILGVPRSVAGFSPGDLLGVSRKVFGEHQVIQPFSRVSTWYVVRDVLKNKMQL